MMFRNWLLRPFQERESIPKVPQLNCQNASQSCLSSVLPGCLCRRYRCSTSLPQTFGNVRTHFSVVIARGEAVATSIQSEPRKGDLLDRAWVDRFGYSRRNRSQGFSFRFRKFEMPARFLGGEGMRAGGGLDQARSGQNM